MRTVKKIFIDDVIGLVKNFFALVIVVGIVLHPFLGLFVIFLASVIALPISLIMLWRSKKNLVPFGPFLLIAFMLIYFTRLDMETIVEFIRTF